MRVSPYIGVSGFMSANEVRAVLAVFPDCGRQLMVGVLASSKTVFGAGNSKPRRYPKPDDIASIFIDDPRCLNLVHYGADDDHDLMSILDGVMNIGGTTCHGVQVNVAWPNPKALRLFRYHNQAARIVLQIGPKCLQSWENAYEASERLASYKDVITDVLIDTSGGRGIGLDTAVLNVRWFIEACYKHLPRIGVGIAGALCAANLQHGTVAYELLSYYGMLSTDAEGKIRDDADQGGNLSIDKTAAYSRSVARLVPK